MLYSCTHTFGNSGRQRVSQSWRKLISCEWYLSGRWLDVLFQSHLSTVWSEHWSADTRRTSICRRDVHVVDSVSSELICYEDHDDGSWLLVHRQHSWSRLLHGTWCFSRMAVCRCTRVQRYCMTKSAMLLDVNWVTNLQLFCSSFIAVLHVRTTTCYCDFQLFCMLPTLQHVLIAKFVWDMLEHCRLFKFNLSITCILFNFVIAHIEISHRPNGYFDQSAIISGRT